MRRSGRTCRTTRFQALLAFGADAAVNHEYPRPLRLVQMHQRREKRSAERTGKPVIASEDKAKRLRVFCLSKFVWLKAG